MKLVRVEVAGYRSISDRLVLHLDERVTVLLGANDHGKTNLLEALTHLNSDAVLDEERDLNWDHADEGEDYPYLLFEFELNDADRTALLETAQLLETKALKAQLASSAATADPATASSSDAEPPDTITSRLTMDMIPERISYRKRGITGKLSALKADGLPDGTVSAFLAEAAPRVELVRAQESVPDSVNLQELESEQHEFMRGIFYYAGLKRDEFASLFSQTDATMMRLETAQRELNQTLRSNWTQGSDLEYRLVHDSKSDRIVLRIKDPAVGGRLVRASQRSSGFTNFFTLKTVLHARQQEHPANAYLFLFDEPGIFLHPAGQYDLLQVLDTIGKTSQIVYSTHSLFMLNKTFPSRHRLIVKTSKGTQLDGKPFAGRWGSAVEALGLSLAGTILFAQYVLLAEGDSDPIYIPAVLQKLAALNAASVDLNTFSVISTETSRNTDALIRILSETNPVPQIAVLVDGDEGGKSRTKDLQGILNAKQVRHKRLLENTSTEDYLPLVGDLYVQAVAEYVAKVMATHGKAVTNLDEHVAKFRESFGAQFQEGKVTTGVAKWAEEAGKKFGSLDQPPSKLGIAREYVRLLDDAPAAKFTAQTLQRPLKLLEWIREMLAVPELREAAKEVTESSST